jgi:hypothetical protein
LDGNGEALGNSLDETEAELAAAAAAALEVLREDFGLAEAPPFNGLVRGILSSPIFLTSTNYKISLFTLS